MEALTDAILLDVHFEKVVAELGPGSRLARGGRIDSRISTQIYNEKEQPRRAVAKVELSVTGVSSEAKNNDEFSYRIIIECLGLYDWPNLLERPKIDDDAIGKVLCAPLYVIAADEAKYLAKRLNMGNLNLPWDVNSIKLENISNVQKKIRNQKGQPPKRPPKKV